MAPGNQDIVVQIAQESDGLDVQSAKLEELVKAVCKKFGLAAATVSIAIVDDRRFCEVNSRFRSSKSTSDCLSFDLSEARFRRRCRNAGKRNARYRRRNSSTTRLRPGV